VHGHRTGIRYNFSPRGHCSRLKCRHIHTLVMIPRLGALHKQDTTIVRDASLFMASALLRCSVRYQPVAKRGILKESIQIIRFRYMTRALLVALPT
jgi:hypothetical protein